jgi:hypothetical protein
MFDRSACASTRVAADARTDLAALTALAALLRHVLNDRFVSSNTRLSGAPRSSRDQNRGEVHATPDEADVGALPRAAADGSVRRRTAEDDQRHASVVRAADGDTSGTAQACRDLITISMRTRLFGISSLQASHIGRQDHPIRRHWPTITNMCRSIARGTAISSAIARIRSSRRRSRASIVARPRR